MNINSTRYVIFVCLISFLGGCSSFGGAIVLSQLLSKKDEYIDKEVSVEGTVKSLANGYFIVDVFDNAQEMPLAIPVNLIKNVELLLGKVVVVDGVVKGHGYEDAEEELLFMPTRLLISGIRLKSE